MPEVMVRGTISAADRDLVDERLTRLADRHGLVVAGHNRTIRPRDDLLPWADVMLVVPDGTGLTWPAAQAVADAETAGTAVIWCRQWVYHCPQCGSHGVGLLATAIAAGAACGWTGDDLDSMD